MLDRSIGSQARKLAFVALVGLAACAHRAAGPGPVKIDPESRPILPSPEAELYATGGETPRDPLVAGVASKLPWDEALSGAAGALALRSGAPDAARVAWAAYRAGYPYKVRAVLTLEVGPGVWPEALVTQLQGQVAPDEHLGLARARMGANDHWVALIGAPRGARLAPLPRELGLGAELEVQAEGAARWRLVSPSGALREGALPTRLGLDEAGEWWLELDAGADAPTLVAVPIYAGMAPTPEGPLDTPGAPPMSVAGASAEAALLLGELRADFSLGPLRADETLAMLGREPLEAAVAGRWDGAAAAARAEGAGFRDAAAARCVAPTVALCLDAMMRDADGRAALLSPDRALVGVAVALEVDRVRLALLAAGE